MADMWNKNWFWECFILMGVNLLLITNALESVYEEYIYIFKTNDMVSSCCRGCAVKPHVVEPNCNLLT